MIRLLFELGEHSNIPCCQGFALVLLAFVILAGIGSMFGEAK